MKMLTIEHVEEPKSFADVKFTRADFYAARKAGPRTVPYVTAMEAIQNGNGLYRLKAPPKPEVDVKVGGRSVDEMSNDELKLAALSLGVRLKGPGVKKNLQRKDLVRMVQAKLDDIDIADDDDDIADEEAEGSDAEE